MARDERLARRVLDGLRHLERELTDLDGAAELSQRCQSSYHQGVDFAESTVILKGSGDRRSGLVLIEEQSVFAERLENTPDAESGGKREQGMRS